MTDDATSSDSYKLEVDEFTHVANLKIEVPKENIDATPNEELRALVEELRDTHRTDNLQYAADELEEIINDE